MSGASQSLILKSQTRSHADVSEADFRPILHSYNKFHNCELNNKKVIRTNVVTSIRNFFKNIYFQSLAGLKCVKLANMLKNACPYKVDA